MGRSSHGPTETRLTAIVESAMEAIVSVDEAQRIIVFNRAPEAKFGCSAAQALGSPLARFLPERFRSRHEGWMRSFGTTGSTARRMGALGEVRALRANGDLSWSEETFRIFGMAAENPPPTFEKFLVDVHSDDRDTVRAFVEGLAANPGERQIEYRITARDGETRSVLQRSGVMIGPDGGPARVAGTIQDITELRELEQSACCTRRSWTASAGSPEGSPTTSTTCSARSWATPRCWSRSLRGTSGSWTSCTRCARRGSGPPS